jgi:hypothetical protein
MTYHWHDGITFERQPNGDVHVTIPNHRYVNSTEVWVIPAAEWASIIAAVSAAGETAEQYRAAEAFHNFQGTSIPLGDIPR